MNQIQSVDFQELYADRIGGKRYGKSNEIFKFERIKRAKRAAMKEYPELPIIDLGIGESDQMADQLIRTEMERQINQWENRGYADNGIIEFQEAAGKFMSSYFGVDDLNPKEEILHVMGSKSALSMIPMAFINPQDVTLMTVPGYPIIGTKTEWLGGSVYELPLTKERGFLPDLESIPEEIRRKAKLFYINYPNNPTGAIANRTFYEELVTFAKENQIIIVSDAAYSELTFDPDNRLSFLSIPGAKDVGIEIHSMSKAYNMTGWRLGYVAGNKNVIKALADVKDQTDSGQFRAIQKAAVTALSHPELIQDNIDKYVRRHQKLTRVLQSAGFQVKMPKATFYLYAKVPKAAKIAKTTNSMNHKLTENTENEVKTFTDAQDFCDYLIQQAHISAVPWSEAGQYVRFSVTFVAENEQVEDTVMEELSKRLSKLTFIYE